MFCRPDTRPQDSRYLTRRRLPAPLYPNCKRRGRSDCEPAQTDHSSASRQEQFAPTARASGRLTVAQRFIAGKQIASTTKSVKRTTERAEASAQRHSVVRFTDYPSFDCDSTPAVNCWATISRPPRGLHYCSHSLIPALLPSGCLPFTVCCLLAFRLLANFRQIAVCRSLNNFPQRFETRSVTRAIPRVL